MTTSIRIIEARCTKCGEAFNPSDMSDTVHIERVDGTECGGQGNIVGTFSARNARTVLRRRATVASCKHDDEFVVYPGEITRDYTGTVRDDDMRLDCPRCHRVVTYTGP